MPAKKTTRRKVSARKSPGAGSTIRSTAGEVVDEVEKAGNIILREIGNSFDYVSGKVSDTARAVASTTKKVTEKVTSKDTTQHVHDLLKDVEEAGENLLGIIGKRIDSLRKTVTAKVPEKPAAAKKKVPARKKAAAKKKLPARKKAAVNKKVPARKKAAVKKKIPVKKKAPVKKAPARKKAAVKRKTVAKKKAAA